MCLATCRAQYAAIGNYSLKKNIFFFVNKNVQIRNIIFLGKMRYTGKKNLFKYTVLWNW